MRILIQTGGGDAPGLNAVIRAATLAALRRGWEVYGSRNSYNGLLGEEGPEGLFRLDANRVRGITFLGGTILGTTNRGNPFQWPSRQPDGSIALVDRSDEVVRAFRRYRFDALIAIGGDGSLRIAAELARKGLPVVGVPKTIDNDIAGTDVSFGFDTAVNVATDAIQRLHSTAEAHERVMVAEVMGRYAGWIALHSGLAGTADAILIPEIPFRIERVADKVLERERQGRLFSIVVCAEGAVPEGGQLVTRELEETGRQEPLLGGVAEVVARQLRELTGKDTRSLVLGHLQRGGSPTAYDRNLALRFGAAAVRAIADGAFGTMVALRHPQVTRVPLAEGVAHKPVPVDADIVQTAREMGVCFGD
ncbi:MAG: 6-phosphofructokinase [Planctomycetota bacterium]|nr:MAG: 6-phosphofructokinase [Planctomycetota bacterium]